MSKLTKDARTIFNSTCVNAATSLRSCPFLPPNLSIPFPYKAGPPGIPIHGHIKWTQFFRQAICTSLVPQNGTRMDTTQNDHVFPRSLRGSPRSTDLRGDEHAAGGTNGDGRISRGISLVRTKEVLWILNGALGLAVTARHKDVLWRSALQTDLGHEGLRHDLGITSKYIKISMDQLQNQQPAAWNVLKSAKWFKISQDSLDHSHRSWNIVSLENCRQRSVLFTTRAHYEAHCQYPPGFTPRIPKLRINPFGKPQRRHPQDH